MHCILCSNPRTKYHSLPRFLIQVSFAQEEPNLPRALPSSRDLRTCNPPVSRDIRVLPYWESSYYSGSKTP